MNNHMLSVYTWKYFLRRARAFDAGLDIVTRDPELEIAIPPGEVIHIRTGIHISLPPNTVGMICSRSGLTKRKIIVANAPGIIDAGYTGEIGVLLTNLGDDLVTIKPIVLPNESDAVTAIAQLLIMNIAQLQLNNEPQDVTLPTAFGLADFYRQVAECRSSDGRGDGGFGSTDGSSESFKGWPSP